MRGFIWRIVAAFKRAYDAFENALVEAERLRDVEPEDPSELDIWGKL